MREMEIQVLALKNATLLVLEKVRKRAVGSGLAADRPTDWGLSKRRIIYG